VANANAEDAIIVANCNVTDSEWGAPTASRDTSAVP
jgi:hypothetical protein